MLHSGRPLWAMHAHWPPGTRRSSLVLGGVAVALAVAYAAAIVKTGGDVVLLVPLFIAIVAVAVLAHPIVGLYLLFGAALLFEQFLIAGLSPITQYSRVFQNVSAYTPLPLRLSIADLVVLLTFGAVVVRRLGKKGEPLRMGALGWPVIAYTSAFVLGTVIGMARGGRWNEDVALSELRGPFHLCLLYFLAANLIRERRHLYVCMWLFVLLVGVKALQGILNYLDARDLPYHVEAVTNHEDVVFFVVAIAIMVAAAVLGIRHRIVFALLLLQPIIITAELVAYRRVGLIALAVTLVAITVLALINHPRRGIVLASLMSLAVVAYGLIFWESTGPAAEPIRALRSVFDTSNTSLADQSSNAWRAIENNNIAHTVRQLPLTGVGVGQPYLFQQEPSPLFGFLYWRYITHNAVLWLWLKAGPIGAFALWLLVARAVLLSSTLYARLRQPELRWVSTLPIALVVSQIVFSSVDLGLTYSRTMIVLGTSLGMSSFLAERYLARSEPDEPHGVKRAANTRPLPLAAPPGVRGV